jgi:hypothetical protein
MKPLFVVFLLVVVFSAGIYLGVSDLVGRYGVDTSDSSASEGNPNACKPTQATVAVGAPVTFTLLLADTAIFWSTTEGRMTWPTPAKPQFVFSTAGKKTVWAFADTGPDGTYQRFPCVVTVR